MCVEKVARRSPLRAVAFSAARSPLGAAAFSAIGMFAVLWLRLGGHRDVEAGSGLVATAAAVPGARGHGESNRSTSFPLIQTDVLDEASAFATSPPANDAPLASAAAAAPAIATPEPKELAAAQALARTNASQKAYIAEYRSWSNNLYSDLMASTVTLGADLRPASLPWRQLSGAEVLASLTHQQNCTYGCAYPNLLRQLNIPGDMALVMRANCQPEECEQAPPGSKNERFRCFEKLVATPAALASSVLTPRETAAGGDALAAVRRLAEAGRGLLMMGHSTDRALMAALLDELKGRGCELNETTIEEDARHGKRQIVDVRFPDGFVGRATLLFLTWYHGGHGSQARPPGPVPRPYRPDPTTGVDALVSEMFEAVPSRRGIFAASWGAHYNIQSRPGYAADMPALLRGLDTWARLPGNTGVLIETERQNFPAAISGDNSGYYREQRRQYFGRCDTPPGRHVIAKDWRNGDAYAILERDALDAVLVLPTYSATLHSASTARGHGDCTHHCNGGGQHEPVWRSLRSIAEAGPTGGP